MDGMDKGLESNTILISQLGPDQPVRRVSCQTSLRAPRKRAPRQAIIIINEPLWRSTFSRVQSFSRFSLMSFHYPLEHPRLTQTAAARIHRNPL